MAPNLGLAVKMVIFFIRTALHARHKHNLTKYVAFVDLIKSFDTVSYSMMLKYLERYGAPSKLCHSIARMYANLEIVIKIRMAKAKMGQKLGVRQGDCMAPVFYLFMIMAFAETLEISWKQLGHKIITFNMRKNSPI